MVTLSSFSCASVAPVRRLSAVMRKYVTLTPVVEAWILVPVRQPFLVAM